MNDDPGFVPVVIVGAGPTGITAATKLAQYGVNSWSSTAGKTSTRSLVPFIWTTKSTGYCPGWALPMSSRRSPDRRAVCSCGTGICG